MSVTEKDTTHNGWSNYPTWCVNLWLSNDEGLYNETRRIAAWVRDINETKSASGELSRHLKAWVTDELAPDLGATFAADLLGYALGEVDWYEIAATWLEDLK